MPVPIIRITVYGGVVQAVEMTKGTLAEGELPDIQVWDFDTDGSNGNAANKDGDRFFFSDYKPDVIEKSELEFKHDEFSDEDESDEKE